MHSEITAAQDPVPAMRQQTLWSILPRGWRDGKPLFTVLVTPVMDGSIATGTPLTSTCWVDWFDRVAAAFAANPNFLSVVAKDGKPGLPLTIALPRPEDPSAAVTVQRKDLLTNRRALWQALIRTVPPHVQDQPAPAVRNKAPATQPTRPSKDSWARRIHTANSKRPPSTVPAFASLWCSQAAARAMDTNFNNGVSQQRKPDLKQKFGLLPFSLASDSSKAAKPPIPSVEDAKLLRPADTSKLQPDDHRDLALENAITSWIAAPASDPWTVKVFRRDLGRMVTYNKAAADPDGTPVVWMEQVFRVLKPMVLWYLWNNRASAAIPGAVSQPYQTTYKKALHGKAPYIETLLFHRRIQDSDGETKPDCAKPALTLAKPTDPLLNYGDFQQALATVLHYPSLMQCLGLAFEATADQVTWADSALLQVQFADAKTAMSLGAYDTAASTGVFPVTAVTGKMYLRAATPARGYQFPVRDGYVDLTNYEAITHNFDGDTIKRHLYAENPPKAEKARTTALRRDGKGAVLPGSSGASSYDAMTGGVLPLSSSGISIVYIPSPDPLDASVELTHAKMLIDRVTAQASLRGNWPTKVPVLFDQDFIHGYSLQVVKASGDEVSLTARTEDFKFIAADNTELPLLDAPHCRDHIPSSPEGSFATDVSHDATDSDPVFDPHIGTRIASWSGWSLGVPDPFAGFNDPNPDPPATCEKEKSCDKKEDDTPTGYPIKPTYKLYPKPYRLPRLRFGGQDVSNPKAKYKVRVRAVDILGNALASPLDQSKNAKDFTSYEIDCVYRRHDPVLAPEVLAEASFDTKLNNFGELIDTLAVRDGVANQGPVRYFVPQADFLFHLIEQGALDTPGKPEERLKDPSTDAVGTFNDVQLDSLGRVLSKKIGPQDQPVTVPIYEPPPLKLPPAGSYLPDTYAHSLNIQLHDLATDLYFGPITMRSFYDLRDEDTDGVIETREWPHAQHLRMQLLAASPGTKTVHAEWTSQEATRVRGEQTYTGKVSQLNVFLPAGWQIEMRVSCAPTFAQASRMAFDEHGNPHETGAKLISNGLSSTHTPSRPMTLVHAVKQPLTESYFNKDNAPVIAPLTEDSPAATIGGTLVVGDHRSTGLCVVTMQWDEYVDDPTKPCPQVIRHSESLVQIKNSPIEAWVGDLNPNDIPQFLPSTLKVADANGKSPVYQFADGSYRSLDFVVDAVSRFQSFFVPPPASAKPAPPSDSPYIRPGKGQARVQPAITLPKCNTKVPAAVDLAHILPLLPVSADRLPDATGYRRHGGAFRIHLRRGWYSTGNGEQLAIVLVQDNFAQCKNTGWEADKDVSHLFTRWGLDPMWDLAGVPDDFGASPLAANFLPPPELQGFTPPTGATQNVDPTVASPAAGDVRNAELLRYTPVFSSQDGWYVDVIVNRVPAYNTFVRLALARYQPNSLASRRMSKVILAPFLQLLPDRAFRIMPGDVKHTYVLGIYGTPILLNRKAGEATNFEVIIEVEAAGQWFKDDDADQAASAPPRRLPKHWSDADRAQSLLTVYEIKIKLHHHRKRRIRVNEYEMRTGYKPISFDPSPSTRFYVSFGEPIELPK